MRFPANTAPPRPITTTSAISTFLVLLFIQLVYQKLANRYELLCDSLDDMAHTAYDQLRRESETLFKTNRREKDGHIYTVPSPDSYPYQWFWDSCFHGVILSHFDTATAKAELRSLAKWQFKNGMIPHMIYWDRAPKTSFPTIRWGKRDTSSLIQPPMLAYAVWRVYKIDNDRQFLVDMLPVIHRLHEFLLRQRDPRHNHLIGVINPDESGEDNSPRFDRALHLRAKHDIDTNYKQRVRLYEKFRRANFVIKGKMEQEHWVRDVPINAIFAANLDAEGDIAEELDDTDAAIEARRHAMLVRHAMRKFMLNGYIMWSTQGLNYTSIEIKTWAIFAPLFAGILHQKEAEELVREHLLNPKEFATPYGVPTVARNEPSFDSAGFWRGPVWIATNWFIYQGLKRYGFDEPATKIARDSLELIRLSGFREQYDPLTGQGYGARGFTWPALILDMLDD
jgi:glycogen debranching enzyme